MDRRPLKTRERAWAKALARILVRWRVRPNLISLFSVVFAAGAGVAFLASRDADRGPRIALLIVAALCIQLRLLCNMLDGMVAVEGKMASKVGDIFNDLPDRIADAIILVTAGYAVVLCPAGPALGWCAALLAVMTAYVRLLGGSLKLAQDFRGPMAKPHRMATMTVASIADGIAGLAGYRDYALLLALAVIIIGCVITLFRRTAQIAAELESR
jgi:phosphatidylglycerophosphate synthase